MTLGDFLLPASLSSYQVEALAICLAASLVWAPLVLAAGHALSGEKTDPGRSAPFAGRDKYWAALLLVAILPVLAAPVLAGVGVSLRPAPDRAATIDLAAPLEASAFDVEAAIGADETSAPSSTADEAFAAAAAPTATQLSAPIAHEPALTFSFFAPPAFTAADAQRAIALLYVYGFLLAFAIWAARLFAFATTARRSRRIEDEDLLAAVEHWRKTLGVATAPRLLASPSVAGVCVFGVVRPAILFPERLTRTAAPADLVMMAAHELSHIRRGDPQLFSATAVVRILFWFNPFVRALASRCELAAEEGADALVLSRGADRRAYAACFVNSLRYAAAQTATAAFDKGLPAGGFATPFSRLAFTPQDRRGRRRRLDAILSASGPNPSGAPSFMARQTRRAGMALSVAAGAVLAMGQAALAVNPASRPAEPAKLFPELPKDFIQGFLNEAPAPAEAAPSPNASPATRPPLPPAIAPVVGDITLAFNESRPLVDGKNRSIAKWESERKHKGVDVKAPRGAPVRAPWDGVIVASKPEAGGKGWGKVLVLDHGDGVMTRYAHLDKIHCAPGGKVSAGDIIASVGATGDATGPHLHFETIVDGVDVDPQTLLDFQGERFGFYAPRRAPAPSLKPSRKLDPVRRAAQAPLAAPSPVPAPAPRRYASLSARLGAQAGRAAPEIRIDAMPDGVDLIGELKNIARPLAVDALSELERNLLGAQEADKAARKNSASSRESSDATATIRYRLTRNNGQYHYEIVTEGDASAFARDAAATAMAELRRGLESAGAPKKGETEARARKTSHKKADKRGDVDHDFHHDHKTDDVHRDRDGDGYYYHYDSENDRRDVARVVEEALREARHAQREAFREQRESLREAKQALKEARRDQKQAISEAFRELKDARAELSEYEYLDGRERLRAEKSIDEAMRRLSADQERHQRQFNAALAALEAQSAALEEVGRRFEEEFSRVKEKQTRNENVW